jgi:hypothetical protein
MAQAQGSRHSISYVPEVTFGVTPVTPAMIELRHTPGTTLDVEKGTVQSAEIRSDRQIVDFRHLERRAPGNINLEWSYSSYDDFLEAALGGTWATNVLKAGTTFRSFTIERAFTDVSEYWPFTGCAVNGFTFEAQPNALVTGAFQILGAGGMTPAATPLDASVTAAPTTAPFSGFQGAISEGGSAAKITAFSLSLNNNLSATYVIGSANANNMPMGQSNLTGSITALFESEALVNKFLAETESAVTIVLTDAAGNEMTIDLSRIKYTGASVPLASADEGLLITLPFQALRHSGDASNIVITRAPA